MFVESVGFENCSLVARHGARFLEASFFVSSLRSRTRRRLFWGEGEGESWSRGVGRPWSAREESGGRRDGLEKMAKHACGSELSWSGWNHNRDLRYEVDDGPSCFEKRALVPISDHRPVRRYNFLPYTICTGIIL